MEPISALMMLGGAGMMVYRYVTGKKEEAAPEPSPAPYVAPPAPYVAPAPAPYKPATAPMQNAPKGSLSEVAVFPVPAANFPHRMENGVAVPLEDLNPDGSWPTATVATQSSPLTLRSAPSTSSAPRASMAPGERVIVYKWDAAGPSAGAPNGWAAVSYGTADGFASKQYLSNFPTG
jgi:hypothetical protein